MKKYTIYVARHKPSNDTFSDSKPCCHCLKMLKEFGIRKIVYTGDNGEHVKCKVNKLESDHNSTAFIQLESHCKVC